MPTLTVTDIPQGRTSVSSPALLKWGKAPTKDLWQAYRNAPATASLRALDGDPECLGLGLDGIFGDRDRWIRHRAQQPGFAWNGKSFRIDSAEDGWGFNRFGSGLVLGGIPFTLSIAPSHVDGRSAVRIDYSAHPRCPWWHRRILDELREVEDGIFLGPAGLRGRNGRVRVLAWFAVDTTRGVRGEAI